MIEYLQGKIAELRADHVVVDVNGVAYMVLISFQSYEKIGATKEIRIYTHLQVKEDSHTLYGFMDRDERVMFRQLISISGVGPATARVALSSIPASDLAEAIINADEATFKRIKGIGPKTAKRIILDLRDKIDPTIAQSSSKSGPSADQKSEALSALASLGFSRGEATKTVNQLIKTSTGTPTTEELIRTALKVLSGQKN